MGKGIATQTILLMVVGLVVVGVLIYIVYKSLVSNQSISDEECRARWISQCIMCKNSGWVNTAGAPQSLISECTKGAFSGWNDNTNCAVGNMQSECKQLGVE